MKAINHEELKRMVKLSYEKRLPLMIHGTMGIGKSTVINDLANEMGLEFIDVRLADIDPTDLKGLPTLKGETTKWLPPDFLPKQGKGILFFDEINLADDSVQKACMQLILDRKLGDYKLPDEWVIVGAGNRIEDKANIFEMSAPLKNRFVHVELRVPTTEEWQEWAFKNNVDGRIIAFLNWKNSALFRFDNKMKDSSFPTPRTWDFTSRLIKDMTYDSKNEDDMLIAISSAIGEGTAIEFTSFLKLQRKIKAEEILENPKKIKEIKEMDLKYSLLGSISEYYGKHKSKETLGKIVNVVQELEPEFGVLLLRMSKAVDNKLWNNNITNIPAWKVLSKEYAKYLL